MLPLQAMADEMEREKARQRAHDKARALARAGYVTGGKCFGYDNVPVTGANGERSHVEHRINETEAAIVRRIFELAATGYGQHAIAKMLNAEGAPAPRSQQGRPRAWVPSSVHAVLFRQRYRGEIVWNRTKKRDRWGQHRASDRPEDQWLRVPAPHLRIVPEELWQAAHAKIAAARSSMNLYRGRGSISQYLLPGLARCAWCNGGMHVRTAHAVAAAAALLRLHELTSPRRERVRQRCRSRWRQTTAPCWRDPQAADARYRRRRSARLRQLVTRRRRRPAGANRGRLANVEPQLERLTDTIALAGNVPVWRTGSERWSSGGRRSSKRSRPSPRVSPPPPPHRLAGRGAPGPAAAGRVARTAPG